ncbi:hypothetical protein jhhlp_008168 [Lomentospora prolificans]|uniref:Up-regulated in Daf-2 domain-containing protein n=1 Tax=Lomentospora prolificans TaxID=41688 RepID=A0A2N3MZP3_9PEZI|nr:hypothetical protein jhhlp_008168 [Lomentospora prolificans]
MTKRTAKVVIRNNTSNPIAAVGVAHKYSDDYKNSGSWGIVQPGEVTEETMEVEYNTGFLTTGRDWWLVTWYSMDMKTLTEIVINDGGSIEFKSKSGDSETGYNSEDVKTE